jgi:hypothetical protein
MFVNEPTTSVRLSKRLKELEVPQQSGWYWVKKKYGQWWIVEANRRGQNNISAFTHEEMFDILPTHFEVNGDWYEITFIEDSGNYFIFCRKGTDVLDGKVFMSPNAPEAYAQMYIYLLENGYLTP